MTLCGCLKVICNPYVYFIYKRKNPHLRRDWHPDEVVGPQQKKSKLRARALLQELERQIARGLRVGWEDWKIHHFKAQKIMTKRYVFGRILEAEWLEFLQKSDDKLERIIDLEARLEARARRAWLSEIRRTLIPPEIKKFTCDTMGHYSYRTTTCSVE